MGVGVIAHDASGAVLATMCTTVPFITDPAIAEAMGVWKAAVLCCELRIQRAIFEGDSLEVVQALRREEPSWCHYGQLIADTRAKLHSLQYWSPVHVNREANEVSHCLAKAAFSQSLDCIWHGDYLVFIQNLVLAEQVLPY